jgi:hypothetical protein
VDLGSGTFVEVMPSPGPKCDFGPIESIPLDRVKGFDLAWRTLFGPFQKVRGFAPHLLRGPFVGTLRFWYRPANK